MKFEDVVDTVSVEGDDSMYTTFPYASKDLDNNWKTGVISIDFLNEHFGQYSTVEEMINATESEGLKLYFVWLKEQGILN